VRNLLSREPNGLWRVRNSQARLKRAHKKARQRMWRDLLPSDAAICSNPLLRDGSDDLCHAGFARGGSRGRLVTVVDRPARNLPRQFAQGGAGVVVKALRVLSPGLAFEFDLDARQKDSANSNLAQIYLLRPGSPLGRHSHI
jgi:hypothetical protein